MPPAVIFLSYRRDDTQWAARGIYERLRAHYGPENVFRDLDAIPVGVRFRDVVEARISESGIFLLLIGKSWTSTQDDAGRRRLEQPRDPVRLELEAAPRRGIPIVPVRVDGAPMPTEEDLVPSVLDLLEFNAAEVSDSRWEYDIARLLEAVDSVIGTGPHGLEAPGQEHDDAPPPPPAGAPRPGRAASRDRVDAPDVGTARLTPPTMIDIPGGDYRQGYTPDQIRLLREQNGPPWQVENWIALNPGAIHRLEPFAIAKYPVTNREFARFVEATGRRPPQHWEEGPVGADHPVVWVTPRAARAYARWCRAETGSPYRLPSSREWEAAARGHDLRAYPWGDQFDPARAHLRSRTTAPVTAHTPLGDSPFGVSDLAGNAREWVESSHVDRESPPSSDAAGRQAGVRGGTGCGRVGL